MRIFPELIIDYVLFVLQIKFSLLSVGELTNKSSLCIKFFTNSCVIQDMHTLKMIGNGRRAVGLCVIDANSDSVHLSKVVNSLSHSMINNVTDRIWHNRLGHLSFQNLNMLKDQLSFTCNKQNDGVVTPCPICSLAKQRKLSFVSNNHMSAGAFDLIHCDVWETYNVPTHAGHRYFLTLVDDCTRFTWLYLMKHKYDVSFIIPKFFSLIETQFHKTIKKFRSDNAHELQFIDYFNAKGVIH